MNPEIGLMLRQQLRVLACHCGAIDYFWVIIYSFADRYRTENSFERCHWYIAQITAALEWMKRKKRHGPEWFNIRLPGLHMCVRSL